MRMCVPVQPERERFRELVLDRGQLSDQPVSKSQRAGLSERESAGEREQWSSFDGTNGRSLEIGTAVSRSHIISTDAVWVLEGIHLGFSLSQTLACATRAQGHNLPSLLPRHKAHCHSVLGFEDSVGSRSCWDCALPTRLQRTPSNPHARRSPIGSKLELTVTQSFIQREC